MNKSLSFVMFTLIVFFAVAYKISAQDKQAPSTTLDRQIKAAEEENQKLKRLKALMDENKKLKSEIGIGAQQSSEPQKNGYLSGTETKIQYPTPENQAPVTDVKAGPNIAETEDKPGEAKTVVDKTIPNNHTNSSPTVEPAPGQNENVTPTPTQGGLDDTCGNEDRKDTPLCLLANQILAQNGRDLGSGLAFMRIHSALVTDALVDQVYPKDATLDSQAAQTGKQIGSDVQSSGTTSLVAKGGIPLIMSLATENGAAVSSVNGTTISFRFNPVGLVEYLTTGGTKNLIPAPPPGGFTKFLRKTAIGLSYDMSRGVPSPTFTGSRDQFSGASFRYALIDQRSPTAKKAQDLTRSFIAQTGLPLDARLVAALQAIYSLDDDSKIPAEIKNFRDDILLKAITDNTAKIGKADVKDRTKLLYDILVSAFAKAPVDSIKKNTLLFDATKQFADALRGYQTAEEDLQRRLKTGTLITFDYNYSRSFTASDTSNFRLIYEKGWENGTDFTFNGSATIFHNPKVSVPMMTPATPGIPQKRFRDFSFATQFDLPLTALSGSFKDSTFSLAVKYQRMNSDFVTLFDGTTVTGIKGNILLGQAKLLFPVGKTGLFLPVSFTYANRTELIKERKSRGNFGFTFDFSSLIQKYHGR